MVVLREFFPLITCAFVLYIADVENDFRSWITSTTNTLTRSYNVPFYADIYTMSGYPEQEKARGPAASYQLAPRAPLFRRDAGKVDSLSALQAFMLSNTYGSGDPLSPTPLAAIGMVAMQLCFIRGSLLYVFLILFTRAGGVRLYFRLMHIA